MADYSYIGSGRIYMEDLGANPATGLIDIGNVSELTLTPAEDVKELLDYTSPGGGTYNEVRRISSVEMSMTIREFSPENIARILRGNASSTVAGTITGEVHTANPGAFIPTQYPPVVVSAVTNSAGSTTYVQGTDYDVVPGGIVVTPGGGITAGQIIHIDYSHLALDTVEALVNAGKEYRIFFAGLNEARSGKEVTLDLYRVRLGVAQSVPLIGEDFAGYQVGGKLLKDTTKTGIGVSQYFRAMLVA